MMPLLIAYILIAVSFSLGFVAGAWWRAAHEVTP
jgi:hypothetical protein